VSATGVGLTILACIAGICVAIAAVALFVLGMGAAPVPTIFAALMALAVRPGARR